MYTILLILLILMAAFFSASETSMMAVNRYRLRHLSKKSHGHPRAERVLKLLDRPDRLLGLTLMGNTFAEILASAFATVVAVRLFGDGGVLLVSIVLTFIILIFGEIAPKTLAALYSQRVALWVSMPLTFLLKIFYPIVWAVNVLANSALRLFGIRIRKADHDTLSIEELRSVVHEATGKTSLHYQEMLLRVLDLQQLTVEEVMVPKNEIYGIDLEWSWEKIVTQLMNSTHAYLPVYSEHIDDIQGMITLRRVLIFMNQKPLSELSKTDFLPLIEDAYFVPEGVLLHQQMLNFQQEKKHVGIVVDEYGDVQGMLTLRDLLEEIAGDFAMSAVEVERFISKQSDGSVLVDASMNLRVLNRLMDWHFPVNGPRTLSGLIIEYLESIPKTPVCVSIANYKVEVVSVSHNTIQQVRVY